MDKKSPWTVITIRRLDKTRTLTVHDCLISDAYRPDIVLGTDIIKKIKEMTDGQD